jgi:hypothetical protein
MFPLLSGLAAACGSDRVKMLSIGDSTTDSSVPRYPIEQLRDPITCSDCHQDHFNEWSGSTHAYASIDPVFRAMNERGQKETNGELGNFCVKCHAPMAVAQGLTTDGLNLDSIPKEFQGVTCYFCHNTKDVAGDHNNPLVLANDVIMRGPVKSPLEFGHKGEYSPWFDDNVKTAGFQSSQLCGSCHDVVVPAHFSGAAKDVPLEQTFQEWSSSVFDFVDNHDGGLQGNPLNCTSSAGCHMKRDTDVPIARPVMRHPTMPTRLYRHEHDFPAVDTPLVDDFGVSTDGGVPEKDDQLKQIRDKFSYAFRVVLCADVPDKVQGTLVTQIENLNAGHYLPSGAGQNRRIWIELHAYRQGTEIFKSGVVPQGVAATNVKDTWILYDRAFKADGTPAHMFWDVARLEPNVIPVSTPRDVETNKLTHPPFSNVYNPDRVTMTIWIEAIGLDVIDDLIGKSSLDPSIRDRIQRFAVELDIAPQPLPTPDGRPVTFDWTLDAAIVAAQDQNSTHLYGQQCLEFPPPTSITITR